MARWTKPCVGLVGCLLTLLLLQQVHGYGEAINGSPSYQERTALALFNAARVGPATYPSVFMSDYSATTSNILTGLARTPLYASSGLCGSARAHSLDQAINCSSGILQTSSCDGTPFKERITSYENCPIGEYNELLGYTALSSSVLEAVNMLICNAQSGVNGTGTYCCQDHSACDFKYGSFLSTTYVQAGMGYAQSSTRSLWTLDLASCAPVGEVLPNFVATGAHIPNFQGTGYTRFIAQFYDSTGSTPLSASLTIAHYQSYELTLSGGTSSLGNYLVDLVTSGACRYYKFTFVTQYATYNYPDSGYFGTYGEGTCTDDWVLVVPTGGPTPPSAPTGLIEGTPTSSTVSLNWTAPASDGGSPITSYTVYYSSVNGNFTTLTEATSITLTGLASSATYTVSVSASNSAGTSSPSLSVTFETPDSFSRRSSCNNVSCLPPTFDFRASYPQCATPIMNQGRCGSCYAFATAAASTDRYCRQVQQILPQVLSPQDILNCGKDIAWRNEKGKDACGGGSIYGSAIVVGTHGLEKASNAALKSGCRPYTVECFYGGVNKSQPYCGGKCSATCDNGAAYLPTKSQLFLDLTYLTPDEIRLEIHQNGPIAADFGVCRNFQMSSRSFNWQQVWTSECDIYLGGHSIVITGWGTLNGIDYWLIANSWGAETQDKGYFRLLRNVNFLEIERRQLVAIQFRSNGDKRNIQVSRQINTNTTDDLVGGIVAGNTSSSEAQEAAQFALDNWFNEGNSTYNETSAVGGLVTNTNPFHVTNITSISYQVVAGTLVYVSFEATNGTEVLQLEATITYDPYHVPIAIELTAGNSAGRFTSALMTILWFLLSIF